MCESIKDVAPHGQWLQYIWAQDCQYQMLQIYCITPNMMQIYIITTKCHNFDILLDICNINTFFWMPCGMNSFSAENCCKKIPWSHTDLIKCCIMSHGLIWDTMPYEFQAQGFWMQISWFLARLGLYCFPIEHIFGICTTLSWHSGFPIPIQLPYLCGKKGYKPGKGGNVFFLTTLLFPIRKVWSCTSFVFDVVL